MHHRCALAELLHDPTDVEATEYLYGIVKKFSEGATMMHSTRDPEVVRAEVRQAMERFRSEVFESSVARRQKLVDRFNAGDLAEEDLPRDVLTTLVRNHDRLDMPDDVLLREICFYLQAGAHSTSNAFTHTVHDLLTWGADHPQDLELAAADLGFAQQCMHESLRLNPSSPMAYRKPLVDVELSDGTFLPTGCQVVLNMTLANRDTNVFGLTGPIYDPHREVPDGIARWGLSFGAGTHACIGAELDGGLEVDAQADTDDNLYGTVAVMVHAFLGAGGRGDPGQAPTLDPNSIRKHFSAYPVLFKKEVADG